MSEGILINIVSFLDRVLPAFNLPEDFLSGLDNMLTWIIDIFHAASWLLPLDVMLVCFIVIFAVDNFALISRLVQKVADMVSGAVSGMSGVPK